MGDCTITVCCGKTGCVDEFSQQSFTVKIAPGKGAKLKKMAADLGLDKSDIARNAIYAAIAFYDEHNYLPFPVRGIFKATGRDAVKALARDVKATTGVPLAQLRPKTTKRGGGAG